LTSNLIINDVYDQFDDFYSGQNSVHFGECHFAGEYEKDVDFVDRRLRVHR